MQTCFRSEFKLLFPFLDKVLCRLPPPRGDVCAELSYPLALTWFLHGQHCMSSGRPALLEVLLMNKEIPFLLHVKLTGHKQK